MSAQGFWPYVIIVGVITAFVVGVVAWQKLSKGRKVQQILYLLAAVGAATEGIWILASNYLDWRKTHIDVLGATGGYTNIIIFFVASSVFAAAFWASKIKERDERRAQEHQDQ